MSTMLVSGGTVVSAVGRRAADVLIDGQIRRVSLSHFEPVARDEAES